MLSWDRHYLLTGQSTGSQSGSNKMENSLKFYRENLDNMGAIIEAVGIHSRLGVNKLICQAIYRPQKRHRSSTREFTTGHAKFTIPVVLCRCPVP